MLRGLLAALATVYWLGVALAAAPGNNITINNFPANSADSVIAGPTNLSALNACAQIDTRGYASVTADVSGTFTATLTASGSSSALGTSGAITVPQALFRIGGQTGSTTIVGTGTAITQRYRADAGGGYFQICATSYTSGTATITLTATQQNSTVVTVGPVLNAYEAALRNNRAYRTGVSPVSVAVGGSLNVVLNNPAGSGCNATIEYRRIQQNGTATGATGLTYQEFINSSTIVTTGVTTVTPQNRNAAVLTSVASGLTETWVSTTAALATGTASLSKYLAPGAADLYQEPEFFPPGTSYGLSVTVPSGGAATSVGVQLGFYCDPA